MLGFSTQHPTVSCGTERPHLPPLGPAGVTKILPWDARLSRNPVSGRPFRQRNRATSITYVCHTRPTPIGERFVRDREALKRPLPAPFDACDKQGTRVNSLSLVRYRTNDYSVPVAYGHQEVWIRGYVHEVVIGCGAGIIARHPRSYDREDMVFDPIHYLALLEHKIGALDQAAPLAGWELPDAFPTLRRLLEARMGKAGKREYVQVLRLVETFDLEVLHGAVKDALRLGAIGYDAVKHLVLCRIERRPPKLDLDIYPYLPRANVATTAAASYMSLLGGGAS